MKYSIIIPVYNTGKYLEKCLDSVIGQTYENYEIIIVNDGSTDNSESIIKDYVSKNSKIKYIFKKNEGLSEARNDGVKSSNGDYLLFVDSDDYIEDVTLERLNEYTKKGYNLISFNAHCKDEHGNSLFKITKPDFEVTNGQNAIKSFIESSSNFVSACLFAYNATFYKKHDFKFTKGKYYEDFGLLPLIIVESNSVISIKDDLYNYIHVPGSITRTKSDEKIIKKSKDVLYFFDVLNKEFKENKTISEDTKKIIYSFLANSVILWAKNLDKKERKEYFKKLKKLKVIDMLLADNLKRKLKKMIINININWYLKLAK